jgi:hypothetical protein
MIVSCRAEWPPGYRPSTTFAMMFFCTSWEPPKIEAAREFR